MAKADIWMPLFIGDYLADTTRLSTEQHGAYLLLIMDYWRSGPPPDDDFVLAQITRMSPHAWSNARSIILAFFKHANGVLVHSRIDREKEEARDSKAKFKARAEIASAKRWGKHAPSIATSIATSNSQAMLEECPLPLPLPLPTESKSKTSSASADAGYSKSFESFWELYPKRLNKGSAFKAFKRINPSEYAGVRAGLSGKVKCDDWIKDGGKFIPHAATWLNARGWEDESAIVETKFDMQEFLRGKVS